MKIAILGTGMVGQGLAAALKAKGHEVTIGTRDAAASLASTEPSPFGLPAFGLWHQNHADIHVASFAEAARFGDVLINATNGGASLQALALAGLDTVGNKVLIDVANDLDTSKGMPPRSRISDVDGAGLAERIQATYPNLRVVKTLNTMNVSVMVNPALVAGGNTTVFMSGNDADAKGVARELLQALGWTDIMDLGDITSSRATEMLMPVWLKIWAAVGKPPFNFKIAR